MVRNDPTSTRLILVLYKTTNGTGTLKKYKIIQWCDHLKQQIVEFLVSDPNSYFLFKRCMLKCNHINSLTTLVICQGQVERAIMKTKSHTNFQSNTIIVHNCTIFLCSLCFGNIDDHDQCRGPSIMEKDYLANYYTLCLLALSMNGFVPAVQVWLRVWEICLPNVLLPLLWGESNISKNIFKIPFIHIFVHHDSLVLNPHWRYYHT